MDAGKAIAAMMSNAGDLLDYIEVIGRGRVLTRPSAPFLAIPTTAGTGAEVTRNAVLASPAHRVKVSLRSPGCCRDRAGGPGVDPRLPPALTASTGLDALTQLIEPYVCPRANPMTDALCVEGMRRAARSLARRLCRRPTIRRARIWRWGVCLADWPWPTPAWARSRFRRRHRRHVSRPARRRLRGAPAPRDGGQPPRPAGTPTAAARLWAVTRVARLLTGNPGRPGRRGGLGAPLVADLQSRFLAPTDQGRTRRRFGGQSRPSQQHESQPHRPDPGRIGSHFAASPVIWHTIRPWHPWDTPFVVANKPGASSRSLKHWTGRDLLPGNISRPPAFAQQVYSTPRSCWSRTAWKPTRC